MPQYSILLQGNSMLNGYVFAFYSNECWIRLCMIRNGGPHLVLG